MNVIDRTIQRIEAALGIPVDDEDARVLDYVRKQLAPDALKKREERGDGNVTHLIEVAQQVLKHYEKESAA